MQDVEPRTVINNNLCIFTCINIQSMRDIAETRIPGPLQTPRNRELIVVTGANKKVSLTKGVEYFFISMHCISHSSNLIFLLSTSKSRG